MTKEEIQSIFGSRIVSFHAVFAKAIGSVPAAVMLSQAFFWQEKAKSKDGVKIGEEMFFSKTGEEWYEETGLTESQQLTARKHLLSAGFWMEQRAGLPAKMCYRIDVESLVAVISRYLKTGQQVATDNRKQSRELTRTSSGKFRQLEAVENGNNIKVENKGELKGELEREREAEKNSLSPAESSRLEAKPLEGDNLPGGVLAEIHDGETGATVYDLIPPAPVTAAPAHRIELGDRPTAETPGQLQKNLEAFYAEPDWQNEWDDGVCRISGVWIPDSPQKEARLKSILSDFCDHAIKNNQQRDTYRQLNAAFQQWVKRERYATWKQPKQAAQNGQQQPTTGIPYQIRKL